MTDFNRVFLDTSPIIYYLQGNTLYFEQIKDIFRYFRRNNVSFVSSDITVAEYLVMPYRENNSFLVDALDRFIRLAQVEIIHTSDIIAKIAARIRANYKGFKAMDSLQIATAIESGYDIFLTNDKQLKQCAEMKCVTVDDMAEILRGIG